MIQQSIQHLSVLVDAGWVCDAGNTLPLLKGAGSRPRTGGVRHTSDVTIDHKPKAAAVATGKQRQAATRAAAHKGRLLPVLLLGKHRLGRDAASTNTQGRTHGLLGTKH